MFNPPIFQPKTVLNLDCSLISLFNSSILLATYGWAHETKELMASFGFIAECLICWFTFIWQLDDMELVVSWALDELSLSSTFMSSKIWITEEKNTRLSAAHQSIDVQEHQTLAHLNHHDHGLWRMQSYIWVWGQARWRVWCAPIVCARFIWGFLDNECMVDIWI